MPGVGKAGRSFVPKSFAIPGVTARVTAPGYMARALSMEA